MLRAVLFVVFVAPWPALAASSWPVAKGPSREPTPFVYDAKVVAKGPRAFFDDSSATILYAGTTHIVEADGTIESITHEITRLNGRKGVDKLGEFRGISFTPSHQKVTLNEARIHKASGKIVLVEPRHAHLRDVSTDYQVYDPEKQLILSFPGLEAGDTIEVKWSIRGKNPEHAGQFFTRYTLGDPQYPMLRDEVRIQLPKTRSLKHATVNGKIEPTITDSGDQRLFHWKMRTIDRPSRDENLPSKEELRTVVVASTFPSWEQVGLWKKNLRESCWKCTPDVKKVVEVVTKGLTTPTEKARALTYWLRRNIRYNSAGEKHDYTPHPPAKVLANRFGDCKDTSQLLAVMLREVGINVELATLGTQDDGQVHPDVPSPWGTHAILLATIAGKKHWIDTTAALSGWDVLPRDDRDRLCYLTDDKGKIRLERTPVATPEGNRVEQVTDVSIGNDGTSRCRRSVVSYGAAAVTARDSYVEVPSGERHRQLTAKLQDSNSRSRLLRLTLDEKALLNFDEPVRINMEFEIGRHFSGTTDLEGSVTDSPIWTKLLAYNIDPDRLTPFVLFAPFESTHTYRFHLPAAFGLESVPRSKVVRSRWGMFEVNTKALDEDDIVRHLEVQFHIRLDKVRVEPADLEAFRKFHETIGRDYRVWLTLKPVTDPGSATLLECGLLLAPENALAASTLAKIYLKAERFADARRVLDRACYYLPENVELRELRVQAATTTADEVAAQQELIRHHPGKLAYAIDLGALLISQGKQTEARVVLEPITKNGSSSEKAKAYYQLARSHYRKDELKLALAEFDLAAKADDTVTDALKPQMLRGQILEELRQTAAAIKAYQKALGYEPRNQELLLSLVRLSLVEKKNLVASDYLRRYTLQVGKDVSGLVLAAETYFRMKRYDDALELALRAREIGFSAKGQRLLGLLYLRKDDFARAVRHLEKAEADSLVVTALLRATIALGKVTEVESLLHRAGKIDNPPPALQRACDRARRIQSRRLELGKRVKLPINQEAALDAVACAEDLRREQAPIAQVEALLKKALAASVAIGPAYALRAGLALGRGELRRALEDANRAIELCPEDGAGYQVRGRIRLERGLPDAILDLQKAAKLSANRDTEPLSALADALASAGRIKEALETARTALKIRPTDPNLLEQVRHLEELAKKKRAG